MKITFIYLFKFFSRFEKLLSKEPIAHGRKSSIFTIPKQIKEKTRISKMEKRISKKIKRLELIQEAKKKTFNEAEVISSKKQKLEEELNKKDSIIQIEEKKIESESEINAKLASM